MIETTILSSLVYNEEYARKVLPYLKVDYFQQNGHKIVLKLIRDYFLKYKTSPNLVTLNVDLEQLQIVEHVHKDAVTTLSGLADSPVDSQWLMNSTEEFCKRQAFFNAIQKAADVLKDPAKYGSTAQMVSDALAVSFDPRIGHDFFEDAEMRHESYHEKKDHLPCDLELFNKTTKGGFVTKSTVMFLAPTGVGKSLVLCHFASSFLMQGKNVLYITMEMSEEKIAERIDANLLDIPINELEIVDRTGYMNRINRLKTKSVGKLIVKEYPARSAHSGHFRHLIQELKLKKKFVPDVIMVDYVGICASATAAKGANSHDYQQAVAEELRGLATEFNCRVFSAAQINREGTKASDFESTDIAGSWGVPATADYMYGLVVTEELAKRGQIKIKRLKDRYADYITWYPAFLIGIDRSKMRLYDIEEVEEVRGHHGTVNTNLQEETKESDFNQSRFQSLINN